MARIPVTILTLSTALVLCACRDRGHEAVPPEQAQAPAAAAGETTPGAGHVPPGVGRDDRAVVIASDTEPAHLVDAAGQALYLLKGNEDGSRCDQACEGAWPPAIADDVQPVPGPGVRRELLATQQRPDGALHVTYAGHPLYRYAGDAGAGRTAGQGVSDQWGEWALVAVQGTAVPAD